MHDRLSKMTLKENNSIQDTLYFQKHGKFKAHTYFMLILFSFNFNLILFYFNGAF